VRCKIGIMGGTFDPIHNGHLVAASEVADRFALDEVVFVPTGQPWQKVEREVSRAEDRYLMTVVATASNPRFTVSRVDIDRGGPTYTVDTLSDLHAELPDAELYFITGADALGDDHLPDGAVSRVEVPAMAISSTDCRTRVAEGRPVWYLVPDGVVQYISKRNLYRN
jgi:nicotinate-nucleotide adenylyltransferase